MPHDGLRRLRGVPQAPAHRGRHRGAGRHPFRPPRAGRRAAHPLLVRGVERGDRARHRAPGDVRPPRKALSKPDPLDDNRAARDAVLAGVRKALGRRGASDEARSEALAYIAAHRQGPRPAMPADLVARYTERATDMASTVERIGTAGEIPGAVARYLAQLDLPASI